MNELGLVEEVTAASCSPSSQSNHNTIQILRYILLYNYYCNDMVVLRERNK